MEVVMTQENVASTHALEPAISIREYETRLVQIEHASGERRAKLARDLVWTLERKNMWDLHDALEFRLLAIGGKELACYAYCVGYVV